MNSHRLRIWRVLLGEGDRDESVVIGVARYGELDVCTLSARVHSFQDRAARHLIHRSSARS